MRRESISYSDPGVKYRIKTAIINFLYTPAFNSLQEKLEHLIVKNTLIGKYPQKAFTYKGRYYGSGDPPKSLRMNRLVPELVDEMDEYLAESGELTEKELPYVEGYITKVLNYSNSIEIYKRLLPDYLHAIIDNTAQFIPCLDSISDAEIESIKQNHTYPLELMAKRMALNLLMN